MIPATLVLLVLFGAFLSRVPRAVLRSYCTSFRTRHGVGVMLGLTVLGTMVFSMVLATILRPGHLPMELVNAVVVAALAIAGVLDLYFFSRRGPTRVR